MENNGNEVFFPRGVCKMQIEIFKEVEEKGTDNQRVVKRVPGSFSLRRDPEMIT